MNVPSIPYDTIITWSLATKSALPALLSISPTDLMMTICLFAFISYGMLAYTTFVQFERNFGGERLTRSHVESPTSSQLDPPDVRHWKSNQQQVLENSKLHPTNFATCELLSDVKEVNYDRLVYAPKKSEHSKAGVLNMDHIYINYFQLLWAFTFVGPFSYLLWTKGVALLRLRVYLAKIGLIKKKPVDLEALVGKLMLEQSQAIHYFAKTKKDSNLGNVAGFFFAGKYNVFFENMFIILHRKRRNDLTSDTQLFFASSSFSV